MSGWRRWRSMAWFGMAALQFMSAGVTLTQRRLPWCVANVVIGVAAGLWAVGLVLVEDRRQQVALGSREDGS